MSKKNFYVGGNVVVLLNGAVLCEGVTPDDAQDFACYANLFYKEIGRHAEDWEELKEFIYNVQNLIY